MIRLTYQYICDLCKKELNLELYELNLGYQLPIPSNEGYILLNKQLCLSCFKAEAKKVAE